VDLYRAVDVRETSKALITYTCLRQQLSNLSLLPITGLAKHVKVKGKRLSLGKVTCYSAAYLSQARDLQRFTMSEVTADCRLAAAHLCGHPLPTQANN